MLTRPSTCNLTFLYHLALTISYQVRHSYGYRAQITHIGQNHKERLLFLWSVVHFFIKKYYSENVNVRAVILN